MQLEFSFPTFLISLGMGGYATKKEIKQGFIDKEFVEEIEEYDKYIFEISGLTGYLSNERTEMSTIILLNLN